MGLVVGRRKAGILWLGPFESPRSSIISEACKLKRSVPMLVRQPRVPQAGTAVSHEDLPRYLSTGIAIVVICSGHSLVDAPLFAQPSDDALELTAPVCKETCDNAELCRISKVLLEATCCLLGCLIHHPICHG